MKYYQDIILIPDSDIAINFLWQKLYTQLHLVFVETKNSDNTQPVGVSFPEYNKKNLGNILRLFAQNKSDIEKLQLEKTFHYFVDYIQIKEIGQVSEAVKDFAIYSRIQPNMSHAKFKRMLKRKAFREGTVLPSDVDIEKDWLSKYKNKAKLKIPFIELTSLSSRHKFKLFIKEAKSKVSNSVGNFNLYGLSDKITLPKF